MTSRKVRHEFIATIYEHSPYERQAAKQLIDTLQDLHDAEMSEDDEEE